MFVKETKKRTMVKSISWRAVAIINSWLVLSIANVEYTNMTKALIMNFTGLLIFYIFDRIWSKIKYGRIILEEKDIKKHE